jgi:multiple sugar transport system substrate-binding protein
MGGTMKRRILSILLAAVVTAGTLLGCGSTKESTGTDKAAEASEETAADTTSDTEAATDAEPVEITIAYPSDDGAEEKLNILIDEFNKSYPNIKVNYILIPFSSWPDYITKLKTMVAGGTGPDVARLAVEGIQSFVADGMALPFDDFIAENADLMEELGVNDIHPNINAPFQVDGKTYGFAWDWNNIVMFLNKDVFAEKNIELPGSDWNKDKFLEIAQTLTYEKDGEKVYGTVAPTDYFTVTAWLYNNNASVLNEDMTECTLNSPEAIETIQFLHDLVYKYEVAPAPSAGLDTSNLFMNGQIAMLGNGRWSIASLANNNFEDYDIQALPALSTQQSSFGSGSFPVLSSTKHPYEAMLFSSWLSASSFSQETFLKTDSVPSRISVMEKILPTMLPENGMLWRESADVAKSIQAPTQLTDVTAVFDKYMSLVFANEISVEDGMNKATEEINAILAE